MSNVVEKTLELSVGPERVWRALTDPTELARWFPDEVDLTGAVGSAGWFEWAEHGKYAVRFEEMDRPRR
nr:hypothetical protein [Gemmatimonadota bacterium]NIQ56754.1 hypothetical protein [Gemmatimonadota bacterium]NIU76937.1 hypothetical protein [Gammaproteobacteria bacterium]NIX46304.1 hypothetical protein [Gemmatimonadota bacterium]NIY10631.1 hypothetical protein [Gemmatimonadota bacterium]